MNETGHDADALTALSARSVEDPLGARMELLLEREKVAIERERLALERDRLSSEREKWRSDAVWKHRAEGRFGIPQTTLVLLVLVACLLGGIIGAIVVSRGLRETVPHVDTIGRSEMTFRIQQALQTTTNVEEQAHGRFLLRALGSPSSDVVGGRLIID